MRGCLPVRLTTRGCFGVEAVPVAGWCRGWMLARVRVMPAACRQIGLVLENPKVRIDFLTVCDCLVLRLP